MPRENAHWPDETSEVFWGTKSSLVYPGDIDPKKSVLIAGLGPDQPIALDYRESLENPSVVYLIYGEDIEADDPAIDAVFWIEAAPNIETLLSALNL